MQNSIDFLDFYVLFAKGSRRKCARIADDVMFWGSYGSVNFISRSDPTVTIDTTYISAAAHFVPPDETISSFLFL